MVLGSSLFKKPPSKDYLKSQKSSDNCRKSCRIRKIATLRASSITYNTAMSAAGSWEAVLGSGLTVGWGNWWREWLYSQERGIYPPGLDRDGWDCLISIFGLQKNCQQATIESILVKVMATPSGICAESSGWTQQKFSLSASKGAKASNLSRRNENRSGWGCHIQMNHHPLWNKILHQAYQIHQVLGWSKLLWTILCVNEPFVKPLCVWCVMYGNK